ncbi:PREDICTED: mannose-binding protein C-like [Fulmarus glacialis]|uniref:mannose-binding protein C-like n=1 Tax=Fulmarus glacialis TaxID=30455 RepID=UPI00051BA9C6|nr:PREDICTED: mannose-binding protein C-like [Fulmarus glacialis]
MRKEPQRLLGSPSARSVPDRDPALFWNRGEPNNVGHQGEDCATIFSNGHWNDISCSDVKAWICERSC